MDQAFNLRSTLPRGISSRRTVCTIGIGDAATATSCYRTDVGPHDSIGQWLSVSSWMEAADDGPCGTSTQPLVNVGATTRDRQRASVNGASWPNRGLRFPRIWHMAGSPLKHMMVNGVAWARFPRRLTVGRMRPSINCARGARWRNRHHPFDDSPSSHWRSVGDSRVCS